MKKVHIILLSLVLVFSLSACSNKVSETKVETKEETKVETKEETKLETSQETKVESESSKEADSTVVKEEKPFEKNQVAKVGLGIEVGLGAKERGENISTQQNAVFAVVAFDKDGKIVRADIDNAQSSFAVTKEGKFVNKVEDAQFKTKKELGDEYGMKKASGIKKEWDEQIAAFEKYIEGKTAKEVSEIPTVEKNGKNIPSDVDLVSSVTIGISDYQKAVLKAWENSREVKEVSKIGYTAISKLGSKTVEAKDDKGASVQFESVITVVALKEDGSIVEAFIDNAQNTVSLNKDGSPETDLKNPGTTKIGLGDKYGMKKASKIGKEWDEQIESLTTWTKGKKLSDVSALKVDDKGKLTDADLLASVTIKSGTYLKSLVKAIESAK